MESTKIEYISIANDIRIPRMINGLWQLAGGHDETVEIDTAAGHMDALAERGLTCFDMADHYGDAELVVDRHHNRSDRKIVAFTKWCPAENGDWSFETAKAAVNLALDHMGQDTIDLLQYHVWDYTNPTYLYNLSHLRHLQTGNKVRHIGLTNVDAAHLELLIHSGFKIATNQVSCSLIDRRVTRGRLSGVCREHGVGILAYGTLLGGFISEKWLGQPEPLDTSRLNWSLKKYFRFIQAAGGWDAFQSVLRTVATIADRHRVSIAAVATRYVLDVPSVKAVIVGTRLSDASEKYTEQNLEAFTFRLDDADHEAIAKAQEALSDIPGDCGDEYRRPPFLTAAGDLSHHLKPISQVVEIESAIARGLRIEVSGGSKWEPIAGYCRAVRTRETIRVSGTTASSPVSSIPVLGGTSAGAQTVAVLDLIERALKQLGSSLGDVVRTRIIVPRRQDVDAVSLAHGHAFRSVGIRPANTLVIAGLVGKEFLVEIEVDAEVGGGNAGVVSV